MSEGKKPTVRLSNWYYIADGQALAGQAYGHPRFPDGMFVHTSKIVNRVESVVETLNTFYELLPEENG